MNWKNVDLSDGSHERDAAIIDSYSFEILLLEISCNLREVNERTVRKQFEISLRAKIDSAREVFENNLKNIVKTAVKERNEQ